MIKQDDKGIVALLGMDTPKESDIVLDWFEELKDRFGVDPDAGWPVDTAFEPWPPPVESLPMEVLMQEIATALYQRHDSHQVFESERRLVDTMHRLTRESEHAAAAAARDECGPVESVASDSVVDTVGGGGVVPGGSEDGVTVGEGGKVGKQTNRRRTPKVSRPGRVAAAGAS